MIGRKSGNTVSTAGRSPQGFDAYNVSLGDLMRGERATMGKSLLDVQRELRIKASYVAAIENCDPSAFDTPGFIAGYVRSYARYLGMDPDEAFHHFCAESGFATAHGMSDEASSIRRPDEAPARPAARDPLADPRMPFAPRSTSVWSDIEPSAIGSTLVLVALVVGIGYGGWSVLQEIQRVQLVPVAQAPGVLSELDPLDQAMAPTVAGEQAIARGETGSGVFSPPSTETFDRLQRPQALDVPVVVARDAPISTLDPEAVGVFAGATNPDMPQIREDRQLAAAALRPPRAPSLPGTTPTRPGIDTRPAGLPGAVDPQPVGPGSAPQFALAQPGSSAPEAVGQDPAAPAFGDTPVTVVAVRPAWVRVTDANGSVVFSGIMNGGDTVPVPGDLPEPSIEVGESGAVYFAVNGTTLGPVGPRGSVSKDVPLDPFLLSALYEPADFGDDTDLASVIAALTDGDAVVPGAAEPAPAPIAQGGPAPTLLATVPDTFELQPVSRLDQQRPVPQVLAPSNPNVTIVAVAETWVEVTTESGTKVLAQLMRPGDTFVVPQTETPPTVFSGNAGGVYFAVGGQTYGPYGESGQFGRNLSLSPDAIVAALDAANPQADQALARVLVALQQGVAPQP